MYVARYIYLTVAAHHHIPRRKINIALRVCWAVGLRWGIIFRSRWLKIIMKIFISAAVVVTNIKYIASLTENIFSWGRKSLLHGVLLRWILHWKTRWLLPTTTALLWEKTEVKKFPQCLAIFRNAYVIDSCCISLAMRQEVYKKPWKHVLVRFGVPGQKG